MGHESEAPGRAAPGSPKIDLTFPDESSIFVAMGTATRKQREVRQREQMLLDIGRRLLIEQGFAGLSLDRLAEATEYSKGTIYQHFSTKEDLVAALAAQSIERRSILFERATRLTGRPRERLIAIQVADELFARLHAHYFRSELVVKMADLGNRASPDRLGHVGPPRLLLLGGGPRALIVEAVRRGRPGPRSRSASAGEMILFGLFSLAIGAHTVMLNHGALLREWQVGPPFPVLAPEHRTRSSTATRCVRCRPNGITKRPGFAYPE